MSSEPLAGVDRIPWEALGLAYGPATSAPAHLRSIAQGGGEDDWAWFWDEVVHQYTIYPATVFLVPFFISLLTMPSVDDVPAGEELPANRAELARVLKVIAESTGNLVGPPATATRAIDAVSAGLEVYESLLPTAAPELAESLRKLIEVCRPTRLPRDWWQSVSFAPAARPGWRRLLNL